jgi:hypothetical protein
VLAFEIGDKALALESRVESTAPCPITTIGDKQSASNRPDARGILIVGIQSALVNVPPSAEEGAELSIKFQPIDGLTLSTQATYIDSYFQGGFSSQDHPPIIASARSPPVHQSRFEDP